MSYEIEKHHLTIGIIPLTDCAPIVVAYEKRHFARHGLDVTISCEASWASIRDKVAFGVLDGAQMLAGMPIAATLGFSGFQKPMVTGVSLGLNGNAITVSNSLYQQMVEADPTSMLRHPTTADALHQVIASRRAHTAQRIRLATVFPVSSHYYQLLYWMASAGINPQRDVELIIVPPPQMVECLDAGDIDGYCVGEPWNQQAVQLGIGRTLLTSYEIWNNCPEKVFGVNLDWALRHPNTHRAVVSALIEAGIWLDDPANRAEAAQIISDARYVNATVEVVEHTMLERNVFYRYAAMFPWRSHAVWFMTQMMRWGQLDRTVDMQRVAEQVYWPDIYREACAEMEFSCPTIDAKTEGEHAQPWMLHQSGESIEMGPDSFMDGMLFDPDKPLQYLDRFPVAAAQVGATGSRFASRSAWLNDHTLIVGPEAQEKTSEAPASEVCQRMRRWPPWRSS